MEKIKKDYRDIKPERILNQNDFPNERNLFNQAIDSLALLLWLESKNCPLRAIEAMGVTFYNRALAMRRKTDAGFWQKIIELCLATPAFSRLPAPSSNPLRRRGYQRLSLCRRIARRILCRRNHPPEVAHANYYHKEDSWPVRVRAGFALAKIGPVFFYHFPAGSLDSKASDSSARQASSS